MFFAALVQAKVPMQHRAERLRLESAKYHGTESARATQDLAIGLIRKNILQKSDEMKNMVQHDGWIELERTGDRVWKTCYQIKDAFQQIQEKSQQNPDMKGPVNDMEQAVNRLHETLRELFVLADRLEGWHELCYCDSK